MIKKLKANCIHCGKQVFSLYKKQLNYNIQAHEISCPKRTKLKAEVTEENNISSDPEVEE